MGGGAEELAKINFQTRAAPLEMSALSMLMTSLPVYVMGEFPKKGIFMVTFLKCREGAGNKNLGHSHPL